MVIQLLCGQVYMILGAMAEEQTLNSNVALAHDWVLGFRGGERVLECFCELFPEAPLYTMFYKKGASSAAIDNRVVETSILNHLPKAESHYRKLLPLFPRAVESMRLKGRPKLLLSSSHCTIKGLKKTPETVHISYIHSPMRYMYDQYDVYFGDDAPAYQRYGGRIFRNYLTQWDIQSNQNVDHMVANSKFVQARIRKYYGCDSDVIYPFVDLNDFRPHQKTPVLKQDYFLMVTAFAPNKRVDLAIQTFNELGLNLKIIGGGQQETELRKMAGPTVEFLGGLTREEVIHHMRAARAFVFPGVDDFGITPLESLAAGTPVIAFSEGGVLETMNESTAVFFDVPSVSSLKDAVQRFHKTQFTSESLFQRAEDFSKETFLQNMKSYIDSKVSGLN